MHVEVFERSFDENLEIFQALLMNNRMTRFRTEFLALHDYDQGQIFEALEVEAREKVYQYLSPSELADIFDTLELEHESMEGYFEEMTHPYAAAVLGEMYADNAVDILNHLDDSERINIYMHLMPAESAREISSLINYLDETAGSIMTTEYISIEENLNLGRALQIIRKQANSAATIYYVYVVDELNRLVGVISLRDLIINEEDILIHDVMNTRVISVQVNDNQEEVAKMVQDYDMLALPVVGFDGELLGIVTVDDILDVMQIEADSDYSGLAAVDVTEIHDTPVSASKSRLPWLIALLFLGLGTATVISQYESLIESASVLSAFVTLITGTAGNAGTQSLAVAIRKITNKDESAPFFQTFTFEVLTGVFTGLLVAVAVFLIVLVWRQNMALAIVVAVAMMAAIVVANIAGSFIPRIMDKLGFDPAVASGPFITTLSDLTSVFIYFSIAQLFLTYL